MRIGLDLDGVVADWTGAAKRVLNKEFGYTLDPTVESKTWNEIQEAVAPEHWKWLWNKAISRGLFLLDVMPFERAQLFVRDLTKLGDVVVLTSRPQGAWRDTTDWWYMQGFPAIAGFNFFRDAKEKSKVKTDVLIEDNLSYAQSYSDASPGTRILIMNRAYNEGDYGTWYTRCKDYSEILVGVGDVKRMRDGSVGSNWSL